MFEVGRIFADDNKDAHLKTFGYTQEQLLEGYEIAYLNAFIRHLWPHDIDQPHDDDRDAPWLESSYFSTSVDVRSEIDRQVKAIMRRHVSRLLPGYKVLTCGVFLKVPGARFFGLHHHLSVLDDYRKYVINIWCPLQATTANSGTLHVLPNSHKITPEIVSFAYDAYYKDYESSLRDKFSVALESAPGQAVFFDDTTHHWTSSNNSQQVRLAIHCACIPKQEEPIFYYSDIGHPERFEIYRTDEDYYVNSLQVPRGKESERPVGLRFLGYAPNNNQVYSMDEYCSMIANAEQIRQELYSRD